jgi:hypothetical protein
MNTLLYIWFFTCLIMPYVVIRQAWKGKRMTWRECGFFFFGLYMATIPFLWAMKQLSS